MLENIVVYKCGLDEYGPKVIENNLKGFQNEVGGNIEYYYIGFNGNRTYHIICNEEGRLLGLPYNFELKSGTVFVGNVFMTVTVNGEEEDEHVNITEEDIEWFEEWILENVIDDDK